MGTLYRKIVVHADRFGSKDFDSAAKIVSVPRPSVPAPGHVLVKVLVAGIQASDIIQMSGGYGALQSQRPVTEFTGDVQPGDLGCEGVGYVTAVGIGDALVWPVGTTVAWWGYGTAFREEASLPVASLIRVPDARPEWTVLPVSAMTAVGGLELVGRMRPGMAVLVTGAAGGTGHIAVQWAKRMHGARVAGTCGSDAKAALLRSLGADVAVNYRTQDVVETLRAAFPAGFDVIYEAVGGRVGADARRLLAKTGVVIGIGSVSEDYSGRTVGDEDNRRLAAPPRLAAGQREEFFFMPNGEKLAGTERWRELVRLAVEAIAAGEVRVVLDEGCQAEPVGLEAVYAAQRRMRSGENAGKIFARISSEDVVEHQRAEL